MRPHPVRQSAPATPEFAQIPEQTRLRVQQDELLEFVTQVFAAHGAPPGPARMAAEALCYGDVTGTPAKGLAELGHAHLPMLATGRARAYAEPLVIADRGATVLVDYRGALGLWAVSDAMDRAVLRAGRHGIGLVSMRGVTEFGCAAHHATRALACGMIGLVLASGGRRGPSSPSANPLGVAVPGGAYPPFVFDLDAAGMPVSDAHTATGFVLLVQALAGLVSGAAGHEDDTGLLVLAIAPATLRSADGFYRDASALFGSLLGWQDGAPDRYPGWREAQRADECQALGVPLTAQLYRELTEIGESLGIRVPRTIGER
ncbi:Ldh family oxidoreductase [Amycolatopsis anabasis]|uniref:Ldh family oxidoreductase n=1 Tax=Amycolatopsis anabasis TaxID=1840409 RepID=UPI001FEA18D6|nr:Ldh family oxidoreductase [Amycolatopsis anabasis]